ncbi:uncharacterized protein LOC143297217 [Babylonia areolata]|uniref:uncharacterized protein LOC143297217 n=1 Tax=Babylonia areolata TaxID=304850 RepID=UPI003FD4369B
MPGNIVPLYLCKTCKGLFVFESQAENHQVKCNGDAFRSPANLFVCEREHYLELITPSPSDSVPGPKASKKSQQNRQLCERKRRKTSPQIITTPENRVTRRSFLSKDDLSTLTPGSHGMNGSQLREANRKTVPRSRSLPQANVSIASTQGNSVSNVLHINTCCTTDQCTSQQNILNSVVSLATPVSQSFVFSGNADCMPCCFSPAKSDVSFSSSSNFQRLDHEKLDSSESSLIQKNSTPATNLLAYLNQLQQDGGSSLLQPAIQTGKEDTFQSLVHHSVPIDNQSKLYLMLDGNPAEETGVIKSSSVQESPVPVVQSSSVTVNSASEQNEHVDILTGEILKLEEFQFKTVAAATSASDIHGTSQILDQSVYAHNIDDFLPFGPSVNGEGGKPAQIAGSLQTPVYQVEGESCAFSELTTNRADRSMHLKNNGIGKDLMVYKNVDAVQPFQTESTSSTTAHVFDSLSKPESDVTETPSSEESGMPGSVVLFLESDGQIIQTMAIDNALNSGTDINPSVPVSTGMSTAQDMQLCAGNTLQVQVCEPRVQEGIGDATSQQMTVTEPALQPDNVGVCGSSGRESYMPPGKGTSKGKTKTQLRLEELSALREEVLQQAREIPVEGEAKKVHYSCNVCGHVAKSVKFMHNHLQMHADGKVYFQCDQCDFKNRLRSKLVEHQQRHTRSRLLCHLCPATFMDLASLNRHVAAKHSENEDLKCDQCDFKASYASLLKEHMLKHTGDLLCCDVEGCGYKTPYMRALRVHQKRHSCEKKYRCQLCSYEAVEKSTLDRHLKSHTQEKPYLCSHCEYRANTKYGVVVHMQHKHQTQKSFYACNQCSFVTPYAPSMARHIKGHMPTFTCPLCNLTTPTLATIKSHLHQVHQVVNMELVQSSTTINTKDYLCTAQPGTDTDKAHKQAMDADKALMDPGRPLMEGVVDKGVVDPGKALMDSLMADTMSVDSQDLPPFPLTDIDRTHPDPMKLSFHFQDPNPGPGPSGSGTNLTRASSIPDLCTFAGMNRTSSQSDMLTFPGISTVTRSNSMSDLLSFANAMCVDGGEAVSMDVSLSDASGGSMDVRGLSLEEGGPEGGLEGEDVKVDSPGGVLLTLQCSRCLLLLMNEEDVDNHKKTCKGTILVV